LSKNLDGKIQTRIMELKNFYAAEDYHQKYRLKQNGKFIDELREIYPDPDGLRDSTAAARLNGYLAGYGSSDSVEANLGKLGLSEDTRAELEERFDIN
ncbi:peptide-methionine (S)-S-oxide reductase, partial [Candidatus Bipolaricaulota bacterium]|nr:peptide-methionine (S)-S-oxide reductase [Candidatus Bipolaricaulota bacterium]